jgi:hypothetical protein
MDDLGRRDRIHLAVALFAKRSTVVVSARAVVIICGHLRNPFIRELKGKSASPALYLVFRKIGGCHGD